MSSISIAGDTSGSITLQAPAVAGTTTLTLPATTGNLATEGVGQGQTWTDVTASRASSTTYTNSTGRPIQIMVSNNGNNPLTLTVNGSVITGTGSLVGVVNGGAGGTAVVPVPVIIPNGATYAVTCSSISKWWELR